MKDITMLKNESTLRIAEDIKKEITAALGDGAKKIVLYGSYARNEQTSDSDFDIVVLYDEKRSPRALLRRKLANVRVELSLKYDLVVSILLKDYHRYLRYRETVPFYSAINREGIALHG